MKYLALIMSLIALMLIVETVKALSIDTRGNIEKIISNKR